MNFATQNSNVIRFRFRALSLRALLGLLAILMGRPFSFGQQTAPTGHNWFGSAGVETMEYPGEKHFWNQAGLVISPARILAQVGTEVPMFAAVCDGKGQLEPYEKVEWMLDQSSVGSLVSVNEPYRPFYLDLFSSTPRKIDNSYAWSETLPINVILTRGTPQINDDMVMPRGYAWVTVTSAREGTSYVTAYAPDVYSWEVRQKSATIRWIDAEWTFPEPACVPMGEHALLTTCVRRHTTKAPVSDWIVKYCITGGAEATFGHDGSKSTEVATDADGKSTVEVVPAAAANGATCISMELIRSECATPSDQERISIATAATQVSWAIKDGDGAAAPAAATPAPVPSPAAAPPSIAPPTLPPAAPSTTPPVAPPPAQPAPAPKISLNVTGPETAQPGTDIEYTIEIANQGNAPAANLIITDRYDQGLEHATKSNPIQRKDLPTIAPGQSTKVGIKFRVVRTGQLCHVVEVLGPGGIDEKKQVCVNVVGEPTVEQPAMSLNIATPQKVYTVGNQVLFTIVVENTGTTVPAQQVRWVTYFDPSLRVEQGTQGAQRTSDGGVQFSADNIPPGAKQTSQIQCTCIAASPHACGRVTLTDLSKLSFAQDACLEIQPAPPSANPQSNLRLKVLALNNPVKVGSTATFRITLTNAGVNPEQNVRLSIAIPDTMTYVHTTAPVSESAFDAPNVRFEPILEMRGGIGESIPFDVQLKANSAGPAQLTAQVTSANQTQPLTDSATATILP
ncbi:MAG TPA: hypothetical protein VMJ32_11145 [Pirellulales bacterium]|nr:hypothetical protein [Pirellulales bacterium]